ncbi:uncharacterized protein LOC117316015 isoform X1 [Pecten maximus]|uniref:uncharacterized protein LOC117316015 isoform X1 n=1 Tax=Pecten maximus TaxID=6579 RepID=UPI001457F6CA|nr:uncharacterized protein LOC117316015 isoform X1 [Pecten maximus]
MVASTSSAPSKVEKTGIRKRLKRFLQKLSFRKQPKEMTQIVDESPSVKRQIEDEIKLTKQELSQEQINNIDEIMRTETEEGDEEVKGFVTIYDFGGEKVFYNTHHCFMSSNMVFVVVFDVAMCLDSNRSVAGYEITEYWLKNIATYAIDDGADGKRTPPIILVGSHLDQVSPDPEEQKRLFGNVLEKIYDDQQLREIMENHIQDAFPIANLNDSTINQHVYELVWQKVIEIAPFQSQWEKPVPAKWVALEHELVRLKNKGRIILTYDELLQLNRGLPVPLEEREIKDFLRNLKFTGSFHCFDLHGNSPFVVLQPQWTIDAFKAIITDIKFRSNLPTMLEQKWKQYEKSGVLPMEFLTQLWGEERFLNNKDALCIVMETHSLLAKPIPDDSNVEVDYFIVPCMLQTADPEIFHQILDDPDTVSSVTLCLTFNNPFIPHALWDKMIASCIHRFQRLNEPGHDGLKFIQRGFACLALDYLWNIAINCRDNAMKITMFKTDKNKSKQTGAGVNVIYILGFLLRRILEQNHQNHLKYQFYLHNDYRFDSSDKMVRVDDLQKTPCLHCFGLSGEGWIDKEDVRFWFKDPDQKTERNATFNDELTAVLPDRNLTCKEIGRVSRYIGGAYQTFFVGLGCLIEELEQEKEEHRHLALRSQITKIFHRLLKKKADIKFKTVAGAMSLHGMDPTHLTNIIDCNRKTIYEDDRLPDRMLQKTLSSGDVPYIVGCVDIKTYFNMFLELGFPPKTIEEFDDNYRNKPTRAKIKALLEAVITEIKPPPTLNTVLLAMQECDMDTESVIMALKLI